MMPSSNGNVNLKCQLELVILIRQATGDPLQSLSIEFVCFYIANRVTSYQLATLSNFSVSSYQSKDTEMSLVKI